jgi:hypothetical protein
MNLRSDKRQNVQGELDFSSPPAGEAREARREETESPSAMHDPESPASTNRLMEEICERENLKQALQQRFAMVCDRIRPVVRYSIQVVVRAHVETSGRIERSRVAGACSIVLKFGAGEEPTPEGRPMCAALKRQYSVPLPSAQNRPQRSVSLLEGRQLPDVIEGNTGQWTLPSSRTSGFPTASACNSARKHSAFSITPTSNWERQPHRWTQPISITPTSVRPKARPTRASCSSG